MINLLPESARRSAILTYRSRLISVAALTGALMCAISAGLLFPSYFFARVAEDNTATQSALTDQSLSQRGFSAAAASEQSAEDLFNALSQLTAYPRPSKILTALIAARPSGISIRHFAYTSTGPVQVTFSGVGQTRDAILAFKQSLLSVPGVVEVDLPLGSLLTAQNVSFTLTVSYSTAAASTTPLIATSTLKSIQKQ